MAVNSLVKQLIKESSNDMASAVSAGILGDCNTFLDTGSFSLNALLSGSMYGGIPSNKITCLAGSESVGKTFFALSIAKNFLDTNIDSINRYELLWISNFEDQTILWNSKTTHNKKGIMSAKNTFNNPIDYYPSSKDRLNISKEPTVKIFKTYADAKTYFMDTLSKKIVRSMIEKDLIIWEETTDKLETIIAGIITEDLMIEDLLNEEVKTLLESKTEEYERSMMDYGRVFQMVKSKLVRERGLIL